MSLQVEKLEKNTAKLTIEVPAEKFDAAVKNAYQKKQGTFQHSWIQKGKSALRDDQEDVRSRRFL